MSKDQDRTDRATGAILGGFLRGDGPAQGPKPPAPRVEADDVARHPGEAGYDEDGKW